MKHLALLLKHLRGSDAVLKAIMFHVKHKTRNAFARHSVFYGSHNWFFCNCGIISGILCGGCFLFWNNQNMTIFLLGCGCELEVDVSGVAFASAESGDCLKRFF